LDRAGNIYIADQYNQRIRMVNTQATTITVAGVPIPSGAISTVAGSGSYGSSGDSGPAISAEFEYPVGVAVDSAGNLYIVDQQNQRIRVVNTQATATTVAGVPIPSGAIATVVGTGSYGSSGDNGPAISAQINSPIGMALDRAGNLYIADNDNDRIRKVQNGPVNFGQVNLGANSTQNVFLSINTTLTLSNVQASGDYSVTNNSCALNTELQAGTMCTVQVQFAPTRPGQRWFPLVVTDNTGNNYSFGLEGTGVGSSVSFTPGLITTLAGNGQAGYGSNVLATGATLANPAGVAVDSAGNLYVADETNDVVSKVDPKTGIITTIAGNNSAAGYGGDGGSATSSSVELNQPTAVAVDSAGNIYIADYLNHRVRKVDINGIISTVAGNGTMGVSGDGLPATSAALENPDGVAVDGTGNLYIADFSANCIRRVDTNSVITTVAGNCASGPGYGGDGQAATTAQLNQPEAVTLDAVGNLYIADTTNCVIRKVAAATGIITTVAGNGTCNYNSDGIPAITAQLNYPDGVAVDSAGNLYIADHVSERIRKVDTSGTITTVAGNGSECTPTTGSCGDGGAATNATLYQPTGLAVDSAGNLYFGDEFDFRVREVNVGTSALAFSTLNIGQTSDPQIVAVSDVGNASLNLTMIAGTGNFHPQTVGNDCLAGTPVGIGQTCNLGVVFAPTVPGNDPGTITLTDDAFNSPQAINLSGSSMAIPTFSNLTPSQTILLGTTTILTLSGTISAGSYYPPIGETVSVVISGNNQGVVQTLLGTATIGMNGNFSLGLDTIFLKTGTYTIAYSYGGDSNFTSASDNTTTLTVVADWSSATFPLTLTELGTGTGTVMDNTGQISCGESQGVQCDIGYSGSYPYGTQVTLTAAAISPSTFAGWGGACASSGTSTTCSLTMNSALNVTANFVPQQLTPVTLQFDPGTSVTQPATFCPKGPSSCTIDPNAHALTLGFAQVNAPFSLTVAATEYPADGLCPPGVTPGNDFDCRFVSFYNYGTDSSNPPNIIVPQCYPYANGNCVHYLVYYGTPGKEPDPSWYSGDVSWKVGFNNTTYTPSSYWAGSSPRMLDDPDTNEDPTLPYGTDCSKPMQNWNGDSIYCQFVRDITTFYDPTPGLDPIGGKTKQNDVVVAFLPTTTGSGSQNKPQSPSAPGSISGYCVTGCMINGTNITFDVGTGGTFAITSTGGFPGPTLTLSGTLPSGLTFSSIAGWISGTPADGTANTYPLTLTATNASGFVQQSYTLTVSTAKPLTITASSGTMTYGGTPPSVTAIYSGSGNPTTSPICTTTATSTSPVGTYTSFCSGAVAANYVIAYQGGTVTVTPAPLVITASSATMTYGGTVPTITPSYSGFVNGDTASSLTPKPTCTTTATSTSLAGPYPSTCSGAVDPNYTISYVSGTVTVVGLEIAPMSLNFGTLDLGQVAAQLVTMTNTGTSPVTISSVKVTTPGNATGDYGSITFCPPLIVRLPATLPAGKSCKIAVGILPTIKIFSPTASTATLTITDSGAASPQVVPLTAQVINPKATLSASSLTFPAQAVNTTSGAKTVTLTNTGNTPLTIGTLTVSGNFALVSTSGTNCGNGVNVAAGSSCAISVTFTPTAKGTRTGSVKITDNALWSLQIISLSGTGK
jgi:sugar lactone lactonase YvrE